MHRYEIHWYSDTGNLKRIVTEFNKLEYVRKENGVGTLVLTMPLKGWSYEDFKLDDILEIWRETDNVIELQNETAYFVRKWELIYRNHEELIEITAFDANYLLDGAIIAYYAGSSQSNKTDYADDMIKEIVNENLGSGSGDADRTKISIAGELSACSSVSKGMSWRNVLLVCQEIAMLAKESGEYLVFDVVRTNPCDFELRSYLGQRGRDHSRDSDDPRLVSRDTGNLIEANFITDYTEARNYIYVGGQGEQSARQIVERFNSSRINVSKWNRRELFADGRNVATTAGLNSIGDEKLEQFSPQQVLRGRIVDTEGMRFNRDYSFGDLLTVEAFDYAVDCHVSVVHVVVDDNGQNLDVKLEGTL